MNRSRRDFLKLATLATFPFTSSARANVGNEPALVAVTLDLEMARNFPRWEETEWDYQKGNLTPEVKAYTLAASDRLAAAGGKVHAFVVGQVLEQRDVDWLKRLASAGHPLGNHTYDHVNLLASDLASLQFRFARSPWLAKGKPVPELIEENIALTTAAMKDRLGVTPDGFRTPGGFATGLAGREELQRMLLAQGFRWVSSKYPAHAGIEDLHATGKSPSLQALAAITSAQSQAQPFVYPTGLIEVPMSPISDVVAFRGGRWQLEHFLDAIARALDAVIENSLCFDFLAHPSVLGVVDPTLKTIDLIAKKVTDAGTKARFATLSELAERAKGAA